MDLRIEGRRALVLGATSGLGESVARHLAAEGARVLVGGRRFDRAEQVASSLSGAAPLRVDLLDGDSVEDAKQKAVGMGGVDILVLNGGGPKPSRALNTTSVDLSEAANLLLYPMVELVGSLLPMMVERRWRRILAVGSSGLVSPISGLALSNAIRASVWGFLKTLAAEVAADGITVNMLSPGRMDTERVKAIDRHRAETAGIAEDEASGQAIASIPAGRYGTVDEFGAVAAFLCSTQASYLTGSNIRVDGGMVNCS